MANNYRYYTIEYQFINGRLLPNGKKIYNLGYMQQGDSYTNVLRVKIPDEYSSSVGSVLVNIQRPDKTKVANGLYLTYNAGDGYYERKLERWFTEMSGQYDLDVSVVQATSIDSGEDDEFGEPIMVSPLDMAGRVTYYVNESSYAEVGVELLPAVEEEFRTAIASLDASKINKDGTNSDIGSIAFQTDIEQTVAEGEIGYDNSDNEFHFGKSDGGVDKFSNKVDKVAGKELSKNDFTDLLKAKLDGIELGSQVNLIESASVNGTTLSITDKNVDISVPTDVSQLSDTTHIIPTTPNDINAVPSTRTIAGLALSSDITLSALKTAIGEATTLLNGLMSAEDKTHLDTLMALFDSDEDTVVDTIAEILAIFENYPEGVDIVIALASKLGLDFSALNSMSTIDTANDLVAVRDVSGTAETKKVSVKDLVESAGIMKDISQLASATIDDTDYMLVGEGSVPKKATVQELKSHIIATTGTFDPTADYAPNGLGAYESAVLDVQVATYVADGDFKVNIKEIENDKVLYVKFPSTSATSLLRFSTDNGANYKSVYKNGLPIVAYLVSDKTVVLRYDGTNFIAEVQGEVSIETTNTERIESTYGSFVPHVDGAPLIKEIQGLTVGASQLTNVTIKSVGKNLFDKINIFDGYINDANGSFVSHGTRKATDFITIKPSTSYYVSGNGGSMWGAWYDINKVFISGNPSVSGLETSPSNAYYIRFTIGDSSYLSTVQLEQGTVATTYEPYKSETQLFNHSRLSKLPNGVADKIRYDNGVYVLDRYVQEYTIQISDVIGMFIGYSNLYYAVVVKQSDYKYATTYSGITGSYIHQSFIESTESDDVNRIGTFSTNSSSTQIWYGFTKDTTLAQAKTALAGTKIWYQLATPLLANETVDVDGTLIQDSVTTLYQEQDLSTVYKVEWSMNAEQSVVTLVQRDKMQQEEIDDLETKMATAQGDIVTLDGEAVKTVQIGDNTAMTPTANKITIPLAVPTGEGQTDGAMTHEDKAKLDGIASGAQVNVLEGVQVNGVDLVPTNKKVNVDISSKVDKIDGKQLSDENYTAGEKGIVNYIGSTVEQELVVIDADDIKSLDTTSGDETSTLTIGNSMGSVEVGDDDNIYVSNTIIGTPNENQVKKLNRNYEEQFTISLGAQSINAMAVFGGHVYIAYTASGYYDHIIKRYSIVDGAEDATYIHSTHLIGASDTAIVKKIMFDKEGNLFYTCTGSGSTPTTLVKLDPSGKEVLRVRNGMGSSGLAIDSEGNAIYSAGVFGTSYKKVFKVNGKTGASIWTSADLGGYSDEIVVDSNDDIILSSAFMETAFVKKLSKVDGSVLWTASGFSNYTNKVTIDADDNVYTRDGYDVIKLSKTDGAELWSVTLLGEVRDIAMLSLEVYKKLDFIDATKDMVKPISIATSQVLEKFGMELPTDFKLYPYTFYYQTLTANYEVASLEEYENIYLRKWHFGVANASVAYSVSFVPTIKWETALPTFAINTIYEFEIIKVGTIYIGKWHSYA